MHKHSRVNETGMSGRTLGPKVKEPSGRTAQGGTRMAKYPPNALTPEMNKGHHRRGAPLSMKTSREGAVPAKGIND